MITPTDRRTARTRSQLLAAFYQLLVERGYESLTVGAVAAQADVGRSTFYEHFRTKHELLCASIAGPFSLLADLVPGVKGEAHARALLEHVFQQRHSARVLLSWPTRPLLARTLADLISERLGTMGALCVPKEIAARQLADAQLALLESWVLGRPACDLAAMAGALTRSTSALAVALATVP